MSDIDIGRKAFKYFHDWNARMYSSYNLSFEQFLNSYGSKRDIYLDGIGLGIREAGMSDTRVSDAMREMASQSSGKIPKNPLDMIKFLQNQAVRIDWLDAFTSVTVETGKDVLGGFQEIGNSVLKSGSFFLKFLTPILLIMLAFWFYSFTKNTTNFKFDFKSLKKAFS